MSDLKTKFQKLKLRFENIEKEMSRPEILSAQQKLLEISKERAHLAPIVSKIDEYEKINRQIQNNREIIETEKDQELKQIAHDEINELESRAEKLKNDIELMLIPPHKYEGRNVIVEIRAGTGGNEASLFAADLYRMYLRYADSKRWKVTLLDSHPNEVGGLKEVTFSVEGQNVFSRMQFESGVHRVQRVPVTEASGRIHTSAVSVAVLAEPEPVEIHIEEKDIRVDVFRSSGPGGQSVNTTDSAVRITHIPTGIMVQCQDEKSQKRNKDKAMRHLRAKLLEAEEERKHNEQSNTRKSQIGSGDRSEKIRTYNFQQNRVTDHRIGLTLHNLSSILNGDLDELINSLLRNDLEKRLLEQVF